MSLFNLNIGHLYLMPYHSNLIFSKYCRNILFVAEKLKFLLKTCAKFNISVVLYIYNI